MLLLEKGRRWETAERRLSILRELIVDGDVVSTICERHGINRMVFYHWLKTYLESGLKILVKESTRPKRVTRTPGEIEAIIQESSNQQPLYVQEPCCIVQHIAVSGTKPSEPQPRS